ncbi:MAG: DUF1127 domain-containing protein [Pseudomonadota bacterium]
MTAIDTTIQRPTLTLTGLYRRAVRVFRLAHARQTERREVSQLLELDEVLLRDIGLARGDVEAALVNPDNRSAGDYLSARRRCRLNAQRRAWRDVKRIRQH